MAELEGGPELEEHDPGKWKAVPGSEGHFPAATRAVNEGGRIPNFFTPCWLYKQNHPLPTWKKRHFTLSVSDESLQYWTSEDTSGLPAGRIHVSRSTSVGPSGKGNEKSTNEYGFFVQTDDEKAFLCAESVQQRDAKIREIGMMMQHMFGDASRARPQAASSAIGGGGGGVSPAAALPKPEEKRGPPPVAAAPEQPHHPKAAGDVLTKAVSQKSSDLDISCAELTELPSEAFALPLVALRAGFNRLTQLPPELTKLQKLEVLELGANQTLPQGLFRRLTGLQQLSLNSNLMQSLPVDFENLWRLVKLDLRNNMLLAFPGEILRMSELEELYVSGNTLKTFPQLIGSLQRLEILDASLCGLTALPDSFTSLSRLLECNLANNQLRTLPTTFGSLTRLCALNVSDNKLTDLPLSLGRCQGLNNFQATGNPYANEELKKEVASTPPDQLYNYFRSKHLMDESRLKVVEEVEKPPEPIPLTTSHMAKQYISEMVLKLDDVRKELMLASTLQEAVKAAVLLRNLKPEVEKLRPVVGKIDPVPPPVIHPGDDKLVQLQKTAQTALRDAKNVLSAWMMMVDAIDPKDAARWQPFAAQVLQVLPILGISQKLQPVVPKSSPRSGGNYGRK